MNTTHFTIDKAHDIKSRLEHDETENWTYKIKYPNMFETSATYAIIEIFDETGFHVGNL